MLQQHLEPGRCRGGVLRGGRIAGGETEIGFEAASIALTASNIARAVRDDARLVSGGVGAGNVWVAKLNRLATSHQSVTVSAEAGCETISAAIAAPVIAVRRMSFLLLNLRLPV